MKLNVNFHEILCYNSWARAATKFVPHAHSLADRNYSELVKVYLGHSETSKSINKWKSKIFAILIFSSYKYVRE